MRKYICAVMAIALIFTIAGCSHEQEENDIQEEQAVQTEKITKKL